MGCHGNATLGDYTKLLLEKQEIVVHFCTITVHIAHQCTVTVHIAHWCTITVYIAHRCTITIHIAHQYIGIHE